MGGGELIRLPIVLALLFSSGSFSAKGAGTFRLDFQPTYLSGKFGSSEEIDILYLPLGFRYQTRRFDLRITVPYIRVSSREAGVTDVRFFQFSDGKDRPEISGLGDINLQGEFFFLEGTRHRPWLSVTTRVKLPTAETDTLGTGEPDVGAGFGFLQPLRRWILFTFTEYTLVGDPPGIDFQNTLRYDAGVGFAPQPSSLLYASYYNKDSIVRGREDISDIALGWDQRLNDRVKLRTSLFLGLSDTAEDFGFSLGFSFSD